MMLDFNVIIDWYVGFCLANVMLICWKLMSNFAEESLKWNVLFVYVLRLPWTAGFLGMTELLSAQYVTYYQQQWQILFSEWNFDSSDRCDSRFLFFLVKSKVGNFLYFSYEHLKWPDSVTLNILDWALSNGVIWVLRREDCGDSGLIPVTAAAGMISHQRSPVVADQWPVWPPLLCLLDPLPHK